mgnify:CR=1 FL=1
MIDMTQNRAPWYLLTDAEKDALGVREGRGAKVEVWNDVSWTWVPKRYSGTVNAAIYRIAAKPAEPREFWLTFCKVTGEVSLYHTVYEARFCGVHEAEIIHVREVVGGET